MRRKTAQHIIIALTTLAIVLIAILIFRLTKPKEEFFNYELQYQRQNEALIDLLEQNVVLREAQNTIPQNGTPKEGPQQSAPEIPDPQPRINVSALQITEETVILNIKDAEAGILADTNSMDPLLDEGDVVIEIVPETQEEIHIGDIIVYESRIIDARVVHRVVGLGNDKHGWFAITKGDNVQKEDPERIRFEQVKGIVVGIIY